MYSIKQDVLLSEPHRIGVRGFFLFLDFRFKTYHLEFHNWSQTKNFRNVKLDSD